jgi:aspartyl-tRNA(Asn)/glutamyl-tRNA(Gln) amidotransferase subunit A
MPMSIPPTLHEAIERIEAGTLSGAELWEACVGRIDKLNPLLNAFITQLAPVHGAELGNKRALQLGGKWLAGVPIAVKDLFEMAGTRTTAGSLFFQDYVADEDAVAVKKVKSAGGQIIGKTNTHEIALGVTTVNPHFGTCRNPWDTERVPGGSSGGSAVAVATGMAMAALGTDTGGSIRIPASLCGVVGLKPTRGRVSLRGVLPLSWNLDHVGPLTRSVRDAALMLEVIGGYDPDDPHSFNASVEDYRRDLEEGVRGWRIALAAGEYLEDSDPEVLEAVRAASRLFEKIGACVEEVDLSRLREAALANGLMTQADAATYHRERLAEHPEMFGEDVRRRLVSGRDTNAAEYILARQTQAEVRRDLSRLLERFQIILLPSTALTAPPISGGDAAAQARSLTRFTAPFNLTGLPAVSIPCGFSQEGLPIGLQLVAGAWKEARLLQAARAFERENGWNLRQPPTT